MKTNPYPLRDLCVANRVALWQGGVRIFPGMPHIRKTVSLSKEVIDMAKERARQFRLPFSQHIARLIEEDYRSGKKVIMIVSEESPRYRKFLEKNPPLELPAKRRTDEESQE